MPYTTRRAALLGMASVSVGGTAPASERLRSGHPETVNDLGLFGPTFGSAVNMSERDVEPGVNVLWLTGHATPGDGGDAIYKRIRTEPAHAGKFRSADGAWWEMVAFDTVNVMAFGAKGDGLADDTKAIQHALDFAFEKREVVMERGDTARASIPTVKFPRGNYIVSDEIILPSVALIEGDDSIVHGRGMEARWIFRDNTLPLRIEIRNVQLVNALGGMRFERADKQGHTVMLHRVVMSQLDDTGFYLHTSSGNAILRFSYCDFRGCKTYVSAGCDIVSFVGCNFSQPMDDNTPTGSGTIFLDGDNDSGKCEVGFSHCVFGPFGTRGKERAWIRARLVENLVFYQTHFSGEPLGKRTPVNAEKCGGVSFINCASNPGLVGSPTADDPGYSGGTIGFVRMYGEGVKSLIVLNGRSTAPYDYALDWASTETPDPSKVARIFIQHPDHAERVSLKNGAPYSDASVKVPEYLRSRLFPYIVNNQEVRTKRIVLRDGGPGDLTSTLDIEFRHGSSTDFGQMSDDPGPMIRSAKTGNYDETGSQAAQLEFHTTLGGTTAHRVTIRDDGGLCPSTLTGAAQDSALYMDIGAPSDSKGKDGDVYIRTDGTAGSFIYRKSVGAWSTVL